jgi:hypothetical protein
MAPRRTLYTLVICAAALLAGSRDASAQPGQPRFDAGAQIAAASSQQFEGSDFGVGGRFAWHPLSLLGVEAELDLYPGEFPEGRAFSRRRVEGLFGVTAGPRFDRVRLFGKLRTGFLRLDEAPGPLACILIFPPPLSCTLAAGRTLAVIDVGGGVEASVTARTFVRLDAGDRLTKYPGPSFDAAGVRRDSFFGHDFRFAAGAGVRF